MLNAPHRREIVPLNAAQGCAKLFCLPTVFGDVACYRRLAEDLRGKVAVFALRPVGLGDQREPLPTVSASAAHFRSMIRAFEPNGSINLLGWSTGGVFAYEVAQRETDNGGKVSFLGLVEAPAGPGHVRRDISPEVWLERRYWDMLTYALLRFDNADLRDPDCPFWQLSLDDKLAKLIADVRERSASPFWKRATEAEILRYHHFLWSQWVALRRDFRLRPYAGRITSFVARESEDLSIWEPWAALCLGGHELVNVPGHHYTVLSDPHVHRLAELIADRLV